MMRISGHTGILVSLLIFLELTSRSTLATNKNSNQDQDTPSSHRPWSHHNHHHHHHHHHQQQQQQQGSLQRPRVLHDSLKNPTSINPDERNNFQQQNGNINGISISQLNKSEKLNIPGITVSRAVATITHHSNQRKTGDDFIAFPVTTTTTPLYNRFHPGRRVCTRQSPVSINHHVDHQIRFVHTEVSSSSFICCPGWSQVTRTSYGCNRPICLAPCYNGGVCPSFGTHGKCNCPKGFTGSQCQIDVDECVVEKPCAQICRNLPGSYECHCRHGFQLQPDGQSCRKNDSDGTAFEARDLENDYGMTTSTKKPGETKPHDTENEVGDGELDKDYDVILRRLLKLEKQFARGKKRDTETVELTTKVDEAVEGVAELRLAAKNALHFLLETFGPVRQDVYNIKNKFELEHRRIDYLVQRVAELDHKLGQRPPGPPING